MTVKKGLKITNEKSTIPVPPTPNGDALKQAATEVVNRIEDYKKRSWDLGIKFKGLMESSVLPENKSALIKDLESEVLGQLVQLATDINNDEAQPEGTGSVALNQLIMKMLLLQRDICNQQKFRIEQLEKQVSSLQQKLNVQ